MNNLGGPDLLLYLVLAFGGAMFVGNLLALVRPPAKRPPTKGSGKGAAGKVSTQQAPPSKGQVAEGLSPNATGAGDPVKTAATPASKGPPKSPPLPVAPKGRTIAMMAVGGVVSLWALATLLTK